MTLELALRATEILLALAFLLQGAEHLTAAKDEQRLFLVRIVLSIFLLVGFQTPWVCLCLVVTGLMLLHRFQGPYNGGSDRMGMLVLCCLTLAHFMPTLKTQEYVFGYLALQLTLSYFIAGWVKIINPEWRRGRALQDVFRFSTYPVSESLRGWADRPRLVRVMSWAVMVFELCFPLALLTQTSLLIGLTIAASFHLANACLFGLNRFFWVWLAAYPSLLWLQDRIL
ncbi:MAG: hypothetical protein JWO78_469 [Micavibrio sp.]|nr:hypothetical protein [Micavibrio sp.]